MHGWSEEDREALERLKRRLDKDPYLTPDEIELLREIISVYRGIQAWGKLTRILVVSLAAVSAAVIAGQDLWERLKQWLGN